MGLLAILSYPILESLALEREEQIDGAAGAGAGVGASGFWP